MISEIIITSQIVVLEVEQISKLPLLLFRLNESGFKFVNTYIKQFANSKTNPVNVTDKYQGNMTSYILKTSAKDIGGFNTKYLIALTVENTAKEDCKMPKLFSLSFIHYTDIVFDIITF